MEVGIITNARAAIHFLCYYKQQDLKTRKIHVLAKNLM